MRYIFTIISLIFTLLCSGEELASGAIRYHDEATDTTRINRLLDKARQAHLATPSHRVAFFAQEFLGTPYVGHTLEGYPEQLTINTSQLDCTTLVESIIALAQCDSMSHATHHDYVTHLRNIRYRDGMVAGYASRLHYVSDWIHNNTCRGNLVEVTHTCEWAQETSKTINYISTHAHAYPALKKCNSELSDIKLIEQNYTPHRYAYIPKKHLNRKEVLGWLQSGDILLITTSVQGLDVSHMGIIVEVDGEKKLLHASAQQLKVILEKRSLYDYLMAHNSMTGLRVVRLL